MRSIILTFGFFWLAQLCFAQKRLVFFNTSNHKVIEIKVGARLSVLYKGYLGQAEFVKETVSEITDSTITLGIDKSNLPLALSKPGKFPQLVFKVIRISDIIGFRKMSVGRQLSKVTVNIALLWGSYYLLKDVYSSNMSSGYTILVSLGVGVGAIGINNLLFPENIKYSVEKGWSVKVVDANE